MLNRVYSVFISRCFLKVKKQKNKIKLKNLSKKQNKKIIYNKWLLERFFFVFLNEIFFHSAKWMKKHFFLAILFLPKIDRRSIIFIFLLSFSMILWYPLKMMILMMMITRINVFIVTNKKNKKKKKSMKKNRYRWVD